MAAELDIPEDAPAPRLCHLIKWADFDGYGFNLHAERSNPGQFVGKIDAESPAQMAGLREGDRIIEVNGANITDETHRQVVDRIKAHPTEARLLVVDPETDRYYAEHELQLSSSQLNVVYIKTPVPRPEPDSPRAKFHAKSHSVEGSESVTDEKASSTENSPLTDDSIEPERQVRQDSLDSPSRSAPLSPDSGKGEEEAALPSPSSLVKMQQDVVVEAEINRGPVSPSPTSMVMICNKVNSNNVKNNNNNNIDKKLEEDAIKVQRITSSAPLKHLGSSSPDAADSSSGNESITDSLEDHQLGGAGDDKSSTLTKTVSPVDDQNMIDIPKAKTEDAPSISKLEDDNKVGEEVSQERQQPDNIHDEETQQTIRNYLEKTATRPVATINNEINYKAKPDATATSNRQSDSAPESSPKTSPVEANIINNNDDSTNNFNNNSNSNGKPLLEKDFHKDPSEHTKQSRTSTQSTSDTANNTLTSQASNGNSYSGLNLNMTASEMRELLTRRKKFDPKKVQMNIRQKYEIIQQM